MSTPLPPSPFVTELQDPEFAGNAFAAIYRRANPGRQSDPPPKFLADPSPNYLAAIAIPESICEVLRAF